MARRVLFDQSGFKVSKPGHDVLTAGPLNLQFSSDFSQLGHFMTGELNCNWNESGFRSYSLGKTFPTPPIVHLQLVDSSSKVQEMSSGGFLYLGSYDQYEDLNGNTFYAIHELQVYVTTSALRIKSIYQDTPAIHPPLYRLRYTVMDYNL